MARVSHLFKTVNILFTWPHFIAFIDHEHYCHLYYALITNEEPLRCLKSTPLFTPLIALMYTVHNMVHTCFTFIWFWRIRLNNYILYGVLNWNCVASISSSIMFKAISMPLFGAKFKTKQKRTLLMLGLITVWCLLYFACHLTRVTRSLKDWNWRVFWIDDGMGTSNRDTYRG